MATPSPYLYPFLNPHWSPYRSTTNPAHTQITCSYSHTQSVSTSIPAPTVHWSPYKSTSIPATTLITCSCSHTLYVSTSIPAPWPICTHTHHLRPIPLFQPPPPPPSPQFVCPLLLGINPHLQKVPSPMPPGGATSSGPACPHSARKCRRNPADRAGLDKAFMGKNLEYRFFKPGHACTVVIRSLNRHLGHHTVYWVLPARCGAQKLELENFILQGL